MVRHPARDPLAAARVRNRHARRARAARLALHARRAETPDDRRGGGLEGAPRRRHGGPSPPHGLAPAVPQGGRAVAGRREAPGPALHGRADLAGRARHVVAHRRGHADVHGIRPRGLRGRGARNRVGHLGRAGGRDVPHLPHRDRQARRQHVGAAADEHGHGRIRADRQGGDGIERGGHRHGRPAGHGGRQPSARDLRE